ncbi:MAG: hydantoinase B/oxoprolinase family protein, partial [Bradymonadia bacterium]
MVNDEKISVSIDSGGTFTDCVIRRNGHFIRHFKVPSTPHAPAEAILDALRQCEMAQIKGCRHGTTVGTNGLLEQKGGRVLFITNRGFEDILRLGRQARPNLYELEPTPRPTLLDPDLIISVPCRRRVDGELIGQLVNWTTFVEELTPKLALCDAVAVCFLHACSFPDDEHSIKSAIQHRFPDLNVSLSSEISAMEREYERACSTVINAYIQPLVSDYIGEVYAALPPTTPFHVMTSSGGLVPHIRTQETPIETVLSGPAGRVIGAQAAGHRHGYRNLLSFDMGGTSTDVALISDELELSTHHEIINLPVATPMLPIETVGAGGGSIAFVDSGGILKVGPESAGAQPGPACYGHQKTLKRWLPTVTDAHVVLGHVTELLGGTFAVHVDDAHRAIQQLAQELGSDIESTARAVIETCTETMARACRRVALAQGVDTRETTLVAFGGAGGLHACALAEAIGCEKVIFPRRAGVLSADGISIAPQKHVSERAIHLPESSWTTSILQSLTKGARQQKQILEWSVLCRLIGQEHTISLKIDGRTTKRSLRHRFETKFRHRFGFTPNRMHEVELICIRQTITERAPRQGSLRPNPTSNPDVTTCGATVIRTYDSTLVLGIGWTATAFDNGDVVCQKAKGKHQQPQTSSIRLGLEVHHQKLMSIAEEMGRVLQDSSLSTNIRERRDFSCAIFDASGQMLAHAAHIPVHLGASPLSVAAVISGCKLKPNTDYIINDPFSGGTHLPDVTIVRPVFMHSQTTPEFFVANRAHHSDVGGVTPGSLPVATQMSFADGLTIFDEGFRIEASELNDAIIDRFAETSRLPRERRADLAAQIAANDSAQRRLHEWAEHRTLKILTEFNAALLTYTQNLVDTWIGTIPKVEVQAIEHLESDGLNETPIAISLTVKRIDNTVNFDFTQSDDVTRSSLNAVKAITRSAVFYAIKLMNPLIPANDGLMHNVRIHTRADSI